MIFHLVLNSLLVFIALALIIESCLFFFKIKNARVRYLCRLIPVLKLPLDLLIFTTYGESLFINLNPFSCEIYLRELITPVVPADQSIPQYLASHFAQGALKIFGLSVVLISVFSIVHKWIRIVLSRRYIKKVLASSAPCKRIIAHPVLQDEVEKLQAVILVSDAVQTPFAAGRRTILFPKTLLAAFSQEEFEAVLAHELEHLRWKDPLVRFLSNVICSLFWWIPTGWWIKRLEEDQELASDLGTPKYGIAPCALGSAFLKTMQQSRIGKMNSAAICPFASPKNRHVERLETILKLDKKIEENRLKTALGTAACFTAAFCFWMC